MSPLVSLVSPITLLALGLLVAGVLGIVLPQIPGPLLSLIGVYMYWINTGFKEPGLIVVGVLTVVILFATLGAVIEPVVASKVANVSVLSATLGSLVGLVFSFVLGWGIPGLLVGMVGTVFLWEYLHGRDAAGSFRAGLIVAVAAFGTTVIQMLLTGTVLVVMLAVIIF